MRYFANIEARRPTISRRNVPIQILWYLVVGSLSLCADFLVFLALLNVGLAPAVIVGFLVGTLANYVLSRVLAFRGGRFNRSGELMRLVVVALIGVALTLGLVLALTALGLGAVWAKGIATVIVFAWNYLGRRLFVFGPDMPSRTWSVSARSLETIERIVHKDGVDG